MLACVARGVRSFDPPRASFLAAARQADHDHVLMVGLTCFILLILLTPALTTGTS